MNKGERSQLQQILVEYIENPRKMGQCILDVEELFRVVHERWNGYSRNKVGGGDLAESVVDEIAERHNISLTTLLGQTRSARVLACRNEIVLELHDLGFTQSEIARSINRHPSSIMHILRKERNGQ